MQAYVLVQAEPGRTFEVLKAIRETDGVLQADPVAGAYDIIALIHIDGFQNDIAGNALRNIAGVLRALECVVFENHGAVAV